MSNAEHEYQKDNALARCAMEILTTDMTAYTASGPRNRHSNKKQNENKNANRGNNHTRSTHNY